MKFLCANRIAPDGMPRSAASHLGLCYLPMSHKKDARLIRDKPYETVYLFGGMGKLYSDTTGFGPYLRFNSYSSTSL